MYLQHTIYIHHAWYECGVEIMFVLRARARHTLHVLARRQWGLVECGCDNALFYPCPAKLLKRIRAAIYILMDGESHTNRLKKRTQHCGIVYVLIASDAKHCERVRPLGG